MNSSTPAPARRADTDVRRLHRVAAAVLIDLVRQVVRLHVSTPMRVVLVRHLETQQRIGLLLRARRVGMIGLGVAHQPAHIGSDAPAAFAVHHFGAEQVARHAGDAVALVFARAETEVAKGVGNAVIEQAIAGRGQAAVEAGFDALVPGAAAVVVGAGGRPVGVGDGHEFVVHLAAVQRHGPVLIDR